jgi:hypothetical protein
MQSARVGWQELGKDFQLSLSWQVQVIRFALDSGIRTSLMN